MKAGWQEKPLGEVCTLQRGFDLPTQDRKTGKYPLVSSSGISDTHDEGPVHSPGVVTGRSGSIGNVFYIEDSFWPLNTTLYVRDFHGNLPRFVYYLLFAFDLKKYAGGTGVPTLNRNDVHGVPVVVPRELPEQQRIVTLLDEAFDGIATARAHTEKNLQNAQELVGIGFQAIMEGLGRAQWPIRQVKGLAASHKGAMRTGPFGSQLLHSEFVGEGIAVLGIDNAVANEFRWDRRRYISAEKYQEMGRYRVFPGDVLITIMGTCGRCAVVPDDIPLAINTKHLCCITLDREKCLPEYLHIYFLHDLTARDYLTAHAKGSIMAGLNMGIISELPVRLPSLEVQAEIVKRFARLSEETQRLESLYQRKLTTLDELKNSLLNQAFSGQLTSAKQTGASLPAALQTTTPEFTANVISIAYARHVRQKREKTFGRVKEQKSLHLVESIGRLDLGRHPMKDAAGPNDFTHMLKAEEWAKANSFFEMIKRDGGYDFKKLSAFDEHFSRAQQALAPYLPQLERAIDLLVPMDKEEAEVFATVHAAWNNLLIDGLEVTDDAIVSAAREGWHADKLGIPKDKFRAAIALIRQKDLVPDGSAKYVGQPLLI